MNLRFRPPSPRRADAVRPSLRLSAALALALSALACGGGAGADDPVEPVEPPCAVSGVVVSPATPPVVRVGQSTTLTAAVATSGCTAAPVAWATSDAAVATVSAAGVVTGVAGGEAAITATTGGRSDTVQVVSAADVGVAYAYSDQASPALDVPYTPRLDYQRSPGGAPATVTRTGTGSYRVLFPYVVPAPGRSVIAFASAVRTTEGGRVCHVVNWGPVGSGGSVIHQYVVELRCYSDVTGTRGTLADAPFTVQLVGSGALAGRHGFVHASLPATPTYTPDPNHGTNSAGGAITVTRSGTGQYAVRWAGLARTAGSVETVVAAPRANFGRRCSVTDWVADGADLVAYIRCTNLNGTLVDDEFVALVAERGRPDRRYAVVWGDRPTATLGTQYDAVTNGNSRSSAGGPITVRHTATGTYLVQVEGDARVGTSPETVLVTAFGTTGVLCEAHLWQTLPGAGTSVVVECVNANGPFDSAFTLYLAE